MGVNFFKLTAVLFASTVFLSILLCSTAEYGGGVETTNGITIAIKENKIEGTAPAGSQIVLCDTSYAPFLLSEKVFIDTIFVDEYGSFRLDLLPDGFYNMTGRNSTSDSGAIIKNIHINRLNTTETLKSSQYKLLGSISGTAYIDSKSTGSVMVQIIGTDLGNTTDSSGVYTIGKIPAGIYKITGSYKTSTKVPEIFDYYSWKIDNVTVPGNVQTIRVDLNLEKVN
jgi:hypothetical protein